MSENLLRVVPTVPDWAPDRDVAAAAAEIISAMCPGSGAVVACRYAEVTFIDPGVNFEAVSCPGCTALLKADWWRQCMDEAHATRFANLDTVTPCCSATVSLNDLEYHWPAAFAQFELRVHNPGRSWLSPAEAAQVSNVLGITIRQVLSHY
ncbi:hypothetical protein [Micromonospora sp. NBC_01813]|uniref:hypothetical protein n=1 Tax=Micromonospora sp. NBC_01813 TaxID=2975988 RepID=UPI002DDC3982|nr:hypothetical protein [Micromonospora sp. NBC_01813]WSA07201.1 hypothetical protein OG958_23480 [Micromonospora sp. NBC_01813]